MKNFTIAETSYTTLAELNKLNLFRTTVKFNCCYKKKTAMEEIIVMVGYKPKEGKAKQLQQLMREHLPVLKQQNLVTDRVSMMMEAKDYAEVCDFIPVSSIKPFNR